MALTVEALEELIRRLRAPEPVKHFTHCPVRFNGTRNKEAVEDFLSSANFFKETEGITDENALKGLPLLLEETAHTWWSGIASSVTTWQEATELIREEFAPRLPAYKIYTEVFKSSQSKATPTGQFICEKRALLAQLETPLEENTQLDMIYGLLRPEIRDRVPRTTVKSFADLLQKARSVEASLEEFAKSYAPQRVETNREESSKKKDRCKFCRAFGHSIEECRKRSKITTHETKTTNNQSFVKCYGCGEPGVFRKNCSNCNKKPEGTSQMKQLAFNFLSHEPQGRPAVFVSIKGEEGIVFLDTGAKTSLASPQLYQLLMKNNHPYRKEQTRITLADGSSKVKDTLFFTVDVTLKNQCIQTDFLYLPDNPQAQTLLGIDFFRNAKLVIDFYHNKWHFSGRRHESYGFTEKDDLSFASTVTGTAHEIKDRRLLSIFKEMAVPQQISTLSDSPPHSPRGAKEALPTSSGTLRRPTTPANYRVTPTKTEHEKEDNRWYGPSIDMEIPQVYQARSTRKKLRMENDEIIIPGCHTSGLTQHQYMMLDAIVNRDPVRQHTEHSFGLSHLRSCKTKDRRGPYFKPRRTGPGKLPPRRKH